MARILLSDDDADVLNMMAAILTKVGHTVTTSSSGLDTLRKLGINPRDASIEPPDLIIFDVMMPHMDGYTVGRLIRDNPRTHAIPMVVVSGMRELSRLFTATVQVDGFLYKPFAPEEFIACVEKTLKRFQPASSEERSWPKK